MRLATALFAALLTLAASAPAAPAWRDAGPAFSPLAVDGGAVAVQTGYGPPVVRRRDGRGRVLGDHAAPAICQFADVGAGSLLWDCPSSEGAYGLVDDLATGARTTLPAAPAADATERGRWTGVGRHWLQARTTGYRYGLTRYVGRATGEVREGERADRRLAPDLDLPGLWRPLCAPQRIRMVVDEDGLSDLEPGPYALRGPLGAARSQRDERGTFPARIVLDRCGGPTKTLSRCPAGCTDPRLGAGTVAWVEHGRPSRIRVHRIAQRRTLTWRLAEARDVAVLGRRVYAVAGSRLRTLTLPR